MYQLEKLTKEEYEVAKKAIEEVRQKNAENAVMEVAREILGSGIKMSIDLVGLAKTKNLIRVINRELRELEDDKLKF